MKIKVGNEVKVTDLGKLYSTYESFLLTFFPQFKNLWKRGSTPKYNTVYKVLDSHLHMDEDVSTDRIYVIQRLDNNQVYLIGEDGIELVLPRICYILGGEDTPLEINEVFGIKNESGEFRINQYGYFQIKPQTSQVWMGDGRSDTLPNLINYPEKIIRKPRLTFTDDEKAALNLFGNMWIARDNDKELWIYSTEPTADDGMWDNGNEGYHLPGKLFSQITFENSPFNAAEYLEGLEND